MLRPGGHQRGEDFEEGGVSEVLDEGSDLDVDGLEASWGGESGPDVCGCQEGVPEVFVSS